MSDQANGVAQSKDRDLFDYRIELLGGFRVLSPQGVLTRFPTRKSALLLAYLACYPEHRHSREHLAEQFWPEDDFDSARRSLRTALHQLRKLLAPDRDAPLETGRTHAALDSSRVATDVAEFEQWLETAEKETGPKTREQALRRVLDLYRGPLLPGFDEEWVLPRRERLVDRYLPAARQLVELLAGQDRAEEAVRVARRVLSTDPLSEPACLLLIQLLCETGQVAEARREEQRYRSACRKHLDLPPRPSFEARVNELLHSPPALPFVPKPAVPSPEPEASGGPGVPGGWGREFQLRDRFIGREAELARVRSLVLEPSRRVITLTGAGGVGKTRLAREVAATLRDEFPGGIYFLPLAELRSAAQLPERLLHGLGAQGAGAEEFQAYFQHRFQHHSALLILDNLEHLAEVCAPVLDGLVAAASGVTLLATSRCRLGLEGESVFPLGPLSVPASDSIGAILHSTGGQLFLERARVWDPELLCDERNARAIAALCRQLEGLPLAIELAAARTGVLTPGEIVAALDRSLDFLSTRSGKASSRHQSLRAAMEWSLALLSPDLQVLFASLAVFRGGGTAAAILATCANRANLGEATVGEQVRVLDGLQVLQDCSLLVRAAERSRRFRLPEALRRLAIERLDPPEQERLEKRHLTYFAGLAERLQAQLRSPDEPLAFAELALELDNLRAAVECAQCHADLDSLIRLVLGTWQLLQQEGLLAEAEQWIAAGWDALERRPVAPECRLQLLIARAELCLDRFRWTEARAALDEVTGLTGQDGLLKARAANLRGLAWIGERDYPRARVELAGALSLYEEAVEEFGIATVCNNLGRLEDEDPHGDRRLGERYLQRSLALFRNLGYLGGEAEAVNNLGALAQGEHRLEEAWAYYQEALESEVRLQRPLGVARVLCNLGEVAEMRREQELPGRLFRASEQLFAASGSPHARYARSAALRVAGRAQSGPLPPEGLSIMELLEWVRFRG